MLFATRKMLSYLITTITSSLQYKITLETWIDLANISWTTNVMGDTNNSLLHAILNSKLLIAAVFYSPFIPHALEAWAQRQHPNMLFLFYEDMKNVKRIRCHYLWRRRLINGPLLLKIESERRDRTCCGFFGKEIVGGTASEVDGSSEIRKYCQKRIGELWSWQTAWFHAPGRSLHSQRLFLQFS